MSNRIRQWVNDRDKIEPQKSTLETVVEIGSMILLAFMIMALMWAFLVATSNYYY